MVQKRDYAATGWMEAWLRHPVLGDPSFDTFERVGGCVHRSEPPYAWGVNGSLFRDPKDGAWYYYAGLYGFGYQQEGDHRSRCLIYRSDDEGESWACLGPVFEQGVEFAGYEGDEGRSSNFPDCAVTYDGDTDTYWLAYDWSSDNSNWNVISEPVGTGTDSGSALAWAKSPAGPFTRLPRPLVSNVKLDGRKGRFKRMYATTLLKRSKDWIALVLCDSQEFYSWGLACMVAPSPEGPWSDPIIVLSVDRPEYFPAPVEFYPCFAVGETLYAPATSVAASRNYQAVFAAALEDAHLPEAWSLRMDGNAWHSRPDADERYGIWGQTFHGFVHDGKLNVMYPSKNELNHGMLFAASRPWDRPFSDGFVLSGHSGKACAPLLAAYGSFTLEMALAWTGSADIAFDYAGVLGPHEPASDAVPHPHTVASYSALRLSQDGSFQLIAVDAQGVVEVLATSVFGEASAAGASPVPNGTGGAYAAAAAFVLQRDARGVSVWSGGMKLAEAALPLQAARPLAVVAHEWSNVSCSKFAVAGEPGAYTLAYNGYDALLGAGQALKKWEVSPEAAAHYRSKSGLVGKQGCKAKWNIIGDGIELWAPAGPGYGTIAIYIDGELSGHVDLHAPQAQPSASVYAASSLAQGRHSVRIAPVGDARFPLDTLVVQGQPPAGAAD